MKWGEQARVLRLIPGLENAEFVRFGMIHRNTYINGPTVLRATWQTRTRDDLFFAGQISGVEGYVESAASGLVAGRNAAALVLGREPSAPPRETAIGALGFYVANANPKHYEPSNITFGIMPPPVSTSGGRVPKKKADRKTLYAERALAALDDWIQLIVCRRRGSDGDRMKEQLDSFLEYLALNDNASAHTVRAYESDLSQFLTFLAGAVGKRRADLTPDDFVHSHIRAFLADLHKRGNSRSSAARKLAAVRAFGKHLRHEGEISGDPAALVGTPRQDHHLPAHLGEAEMSRLLEMPDTSRPLGRRDRAILELFYASGLRLSELVGLDVEDVNLSSRTVRVMGKGRKERLVPFNRSTEAALRAWLQDWEAVTPAASAPPSPPRAARPRR